MRSLPGAPETLLYAQIQSGECFVLEFFNGPAVTAGKLRTRPEPERKEHLMMNPLRVADPEVFRATFDEVERQQKNLVLIASENYVSEAALLAAGTVMTNKYAAGYPGHG